MVLDERPHIDRKMYINHVGFAPCATNEAHVDIREDSVHKAIPGLDDGDVGPQDVPGEDKPEPPAPADKPKPAVPTPGEGPGLSPTGKKREDTTMSEIGLVIGVAVIVLVLGACGIWCYNRRQRSKNSAFGHTYSEQLGGSRAIN